MYKQLVIKIPKSQVQNVNYVGISYETRKIPDYEKKSNISLPPKKTQYVPLNHQKWLTCQIVGGKTVKNVQIEPQQRRYGQEDKRHVSE